MNSPSYRTIYESQLTGLEKIHQGKVRDIYAIDDRHMLIVTTDRLSAFDVVLPDPIPYKGAVLTKISDFWFRRTRQIIPNQLAALGLEDVIRNRDELELLRDRAIVVRRLEPLPLEAVVRGYMIGSGWKDYQREGAVCGIALPRGLKLADRLPEPIFTPATKAPTGEHDENINFEAIVDLVGSELAAQVRDKTLRLYGHAAEYAIARGIIIADTKFEFGTRRRRQAGADRRGADAGLLAFLAGRDLAAGLEPAELRQAVRARLPRDARLEQAGAGPASAAGNHRPHQRKISRSAARLTA